MALPNLFDICIPREDVRQGRLTESDFAADLAQVVRGDAPEEYRDPVRFFANTHPTRGLKNLLWNVCRRLSGAGGEAASIFRLDTNYGGGKTHALIALNHAAGGMPGVSNAEEFIEAGLLPKAPVRVAAFDGENADPANGRSLGNGLRAFTPWGEIAYALAGGEGYALVRKSDENGVAPGAETIRELFGNQPNLILIDELSVYLRKLNARDRLRAGGQLTAFLTGLFKAVESTRQAALVYTLAIGKDRLATDAYVEENQYIAECMEEAETLSASRRRCSTQLRKMKRSEFFGGGCLPISMTNGPGRSLPPIASCGKRIRIICRLSGPRICVKRHSRPVIRCTRN